MKNFIGKRLEGKLLFTRVGTNGEEKVVLVQQLPVHGEQEHQLGKVLHGEKTRGSLVKMLLN